MDNDVGKFKSDVHRLLVGKAPIYIEAKKLIPLLDVEQREYYDKYVKVENEKEIGKMKSEIADKRIEEKMKRKGINGK